MGRGLLALLVLAFQVSVASAQATNTPGVGGQNNKEWGAAINNLAKEGRDDSIPGAGMGSHSRSTTAANINGGFASDDNVFGITFNVRDPDETNNGRDGVGNVSKGPNHNAHPGDGGNGTHAINNVGLSSVVDPVTGKAR